MRKGLIIDRGVEIGALLARGGAVLRHTTSRERRVQLVVGAGNHGQSRTGSGVRQQRVGRMREGEEI